MEIFPEMTVPVLDRVLVTGDAGGVADERLPRPDLEVPERARRVACGHLGGSFRGGDPYELTHERVATSKCAYWS